MRQVPQQKESLKTRYEMTEEKRNLHCQGREMKPYEVKGLCDFILPQQCTLLIAAHTLIFQFRPLPPFLQIYTIKVILGIKDGLTSEHGNGCTESKECPSRQGPSFCLLVRFQCEKKSRIRHYSTLLILLLLL